MTSSQADAMIGPVRLIEVDVVGLKPLQAGLYGARDVVPVQRRHAGALRGGDPAMAGAGHLGGQDDGIPVFGFHPAADDFLRPASPFRVRRNGIVLGSVKEVDARFKGAVEYSKCLCFVCLRTKSHGAHADV